MTYHEVYQRKFHKHMRTVPQFFVYVDSILSFFQDDSFGNPIALNNSNYRNVYHFIDSTH